MNILYLHVPEVCVRFDISESQTWVIVNIVLDDRWVAAVNL